jgi:hypothetical protein
MRIPHHLLRHKSGTWYFRMVVPHDLQAVFGKKIIKRSLRVRDSTSVTYNRRRSTR